MALKLLVSVVNTVVGALREALDRFLGFRGGGMVVVVVVVVVFMVVAGENGRVGCEDEEEGKKWWWSAKEGRVFDQTTDS